MTQPTQVIQHWIDTIQNEGIKLTKWETDFVHSVAGQLEERGRLSEKQLEILERIYAEKTR